MSLRLRLLNLGCRVLGKARLRKAEDPLEVRRQFDRTAILLGGKARGLTERDMSGDPICRLVEPVGGGAGVILYFHGGGYIAGSPWTHRGIVRALVRATGCRAVVPDYALGPEAPFPAAQEDARVIWEALIAQGIDPAQVILAGDSAGGGLALSLLAHLSATGARPGGCVLFSPWVDASGSGASLVENAVADPMLPAERLDDLVEFAAPGVDRRDPRLSPLFAEFSAPPPVLIQYSQTEILRDDALRMADHLRAAGGEVTLQAWADTPHAWQVFGNLVPEGRQAIAAAAAFIRDRSEG